MTAAEGRVRAGVPVERERREPGSVASRLAEAGQQLEIVLEEIDLHEEPEFGEALVEAIEAVDEATSQRPGLSDGGGEAPSGEMVFETRR